MEDKNFIQALQELVEALFQLGFIQDSICDNDVCRTLGFDIIRNQYADIAQRTDYFRALIMHWVHVADHMLTTCLDTSTRENIIQELYTVLDTSPPSSPGDIIDIRYIVWYMYRNPAEKAPPENTLQLIQAFSDPNTSKEIQQKFASLIDHVILHLPSLSLHNPNIPFMLHPGIVLAKYSVNTKEIHSKIIEKKQNNNPALAIMLTQWLHAYTAPTTIANNPQHKLFSESFLRSAYTILIHLLDMKDHVIRCIHPNILATLYHGTMWVDNFYTYIGLLFFSFFITLSVLTPVLLWCIFPHVTLTVCLEMMGYGLCSGAATFLMGCGLLSLYTWATQHFIYTPSRVHQYGNAVLSSCMSYTNYVAHQMLPNDLRQFLPYSSPTPR